MTRTTSRRGALPVLRAARAAAPLASPRQVSIRLVTLGCDKNTVDSERILARLAAAGAQPADGDADVMLINTCGFIEAAREESIETLLEAVRLKHEGRTRAVVALGCMVQRYGTELMREIPEVDLFLGLTETDRLIPELRRRGLLGDAVRHAPNMERPLRLLGAGARHTSFLKVSEGCDHGCAFCAIPLMRGKHRSTPIPLLVQEAQQLERAGVVELSLVSQDTTWYGRDFQRTGNERSAFTQDTGDYFIGNAFAGMAGIDTLPDAAPERASTARGARRGLLPLLLRALLAETSIPWFRLFYMYPSGIQPELVELIATEPRIAKYLDMPIQHGSDAVLQRMRRPERQATIRERVRWLRDAIPDVALRTTVIAGFPGETDADFDALLELLEELRFDHLGAFTYSIEENTPAAIMPEQVLETVKRERLERLLDLQRSISLEKNESLVGSAATVLVDRRIDADTEDSELAGTFAIGRTEHQAHEIDGIVHVMGRTSAGVGDFIRLRITGAVEQDLLAEPVSAHG